MKVFSRSRHPDHGRFRPNSWPQVQFPRSRPPTPRPLPTRPKRAATLPFPKNPPEKPSSEKCTLFNKIMPLRPKNRPPNPAGPGACSSRRNLARTQLRLVRTTIRSQRKEWSSHRQGQHSTAGPPVVRTPHLQKKRERSHSLQQNLDPSSIPQVSGLGPAFAKAAEVLVGTHVKTGVRHGRLGVNLLKLTAVGSAGTPTLGPRKDRCRGFRLFLGRFGSRGRFRPRGSRSW